MSLSVRSNCFGGCAFHAGENSYRRWCCCGSQGVGEWRRNHRRVVKSRNQLGYSHGGDHYRRNAASWLGPVSDEIKVLYWADNIGPVDSQLIRGKLPT